MLPNVREARSAGFLQSCAAAGTNPGAAHARRRHNARERCHPQSSNHNCRFHNGIAGPLTLVTDAGTRY